MKKVLLTLPLLAAALWSCSSDEPATNGPTGKSETHYMSVSITTSSEGAPLGRGEGEDKQYDPGTEDENRVDCITFYFFDADGYAARVSGPNGMNFIRPQEFTISDPDEGESPNVSETIEAMLVINTKEGDKVPAQIVAVLNDEKTYWTETIEELQNTLTEGMEGNTFIMTNSVYVKDGNKYVGTPVEGHLYTSEQAAMDDPVNIYVERTLAKVTVESNVRLIKHVTIAGSTEEMDLYSTRKIDPASGKEIIYEVYDGEIFVRFVGWNVTAERTENRLIKEINPAWNPGWIWNTADYHRSFWAVNAEGSDQPEYSWGKFMLQPREEGPTHYALKYTDFTGEKQWAYVKENASRTLDGDDPTTPTKVIIAAQLVDGQGNPQSIAEWGSILMPLRQLNAAFANAAVLYYEVGEDGNKVLKKITPDDISIQTATQAGLADESTPGRYKVYATLSHEGLGKKWYTYSSKNEAVELSDQEAMDYLIGIGGAKAWTDGFTYYYFDINHLGHGINGAKFGDVGVVRNHVYAANITSLSGLGTPVYDPDETIYPEKPEDEYIYIAADIKVLSWRVVNFDVPLKW